MTFNVVIATHGRTELLDRTLGSLIGTGMPENFERVLVVENGACDGAEEVCKRFEARLPLECRHRPDSGKGRSLEWAIERIGKGFVLFLDDDVRASEDLLERYAAAAGQHGRGHFFGGPLRVDYEVEPEEWLKAYLPWSAKGWTPKDPRVPFEGNLRFFGANFGAFVEDLRAAGGFFPNLGPGALREGTDGNPSGLELELQDRLMQCGNIPVFVEGAIVWHYVPRERCSKRWALHRIFRNSFSLTLREEIQGKTTSGLRWGGVPLSVWKRYVMAGIRSVLAVAEPQRRFRSQATFQELRGSIEGYRMGRRK